MKKILFILLAAVIAFGVAAKPAANDTTVVFDINPAMHCQNCEAKIKNNLRFEKGIKAIEANAPGSQVSVTYDKTKTNTDKIAAAFAKVGFKASPAAAAKKCSGKCNDACKKSGTDHKCSGTCGGCKK